MFTGSEFGPFVAYANVDTNLYWSSLATIQHRHQQLSYPKAHWSRGLWKGPHGIIYLFSRSYEFTDPVTRQQTSETDLTAALSLSIVIITIASEISSVGSIYNTQQGRSSVDSHARKFNTK
jgi:hypothetical protein